MGQHRRAASIYDMEQSAPWQGSPSSAVATHTIILHLGGNITNLSTPGVPPYLKDYSRHRAGDAYWLKLLRYYSTLR